MAYRIAVTSSDGTQIDTHFGQAPGFYVFEADENTSELSFIDFRAVPQPDSDGETAQEAPSCNGHDEERLAVISTLLRDCQYLLTRKIGLKPYRYLQRNGLSSLELSENVPDVIGQLSAYRLKYREKGWTI